MLPKIILVGDLLRTPIIAVSNSGMRYARFNMVCSNYISKTKTTESHFFNFVTFNANTINILEKLSPGTTLCVEGIIKQTVYEADQKKVYSFNFECSRIDFVNRRRNPNATTNDGVASGIYGPEQVSLTYEKPHHISSQMTDSNSVQAQANYFASKESEQFDSPLNEHHDDAYSTKDSWDFDDFDFED